jgi:hypothetical protein
MVHKHYSTYDMPLLQITNLLLEMYYTAQNQITFLHNTPLIISTNVSHMTVNGNEYILCYTCFLFIQGISEELTDVSFM